MKHILFTMIFCLLFAVSSHAALKVIGSGDKMQLDASRFPPAMKSAYQLMQKKCTSCHTSERVVIALQTGVAPTTLLEFNKKTAKDHCDKMMRKPNANISQQDAKTITELLYYLIDESAKK
ncbi:MAG TPA: cytochrome C [Geobacteraceae bacterium]|nr:cytochrome C [Geobacteraceae bacterium]